ncbi:MAG: inositol monophosphatase [Proteobacteria bacterium]|nr:inositol monophosphatase [Pseudomonadota bacterium]
MTTPITIAISAAKEAGALLKERFGNPGNVEHKGAIDLVTEMDRRAEELIVALVTERFPAHAILAEESGESTATAVSDAAAAASNDKKFRWIIDPLDGTTNYAHGFPFFSVSIGLEVNDCVELGVVYNPMADELFVAEKDKGATLNGERIAVSGTKTVNESLLVTGFPYDIRTSKKNNLDHFGNFALRAQAIRRAGSAALDLCYTACGRFDGYWEMKLKPWDVAAGALIVTEAGGRISDFSSGAFDIYGTECLASNGSIHEEMLTVLNTQTRAGE